VSYLLGWAVKRLADAPTPKLLFSTELGNGYVVMPSDSPEW